MLLLTEVSEDREIADVGVEGGEEREAVGDATSFTARAETFSLVEGSNRCFCWRWNDSLICAIVRQTVSGEVSGKMKQEIVGEREEEEEE